jgi:hypothetical protein
MSKPQSVEQLLRPYTANARQRSTLRRLASRYASEGVLDGSYARALVDHCPDAAHCWRGCADRASRRATILEAPADDGSIFLPWVGEAYRRGGVCYAGWNINHDGSEWYGLLEELVLVDADRQTLSGDHKQNRWGSRFAYRSMASVAAVVDSQLGHEPLEEPAADVLAPYTRHVCRVQAVKCVPLGNRSNPSREMDQRCPRRFLLPELEVLRPNALVIFGDRPLNAIVDAMESNGWKSFDWHPKFSGGYARGSTRSPWGQWLTIFAVWHPAYSGWPAAHAKLVSDLRRRPVGSDIPA